MPYQIRWLIEPIWYLWASAKRLSMSLIKLSLALAWSKVHSKFWPGTCSVPSSIRAFNHPSGCNCNKSRFACASFSALKVLGSAQTEFWSGSGDKFLAVLGWLFRDDSRDLQNCNLGIYSRVWLWNSWCARASQSVPGRQWRWLWYSGEEGNPSVSTARCLLIPFVAVVTKPLGCNTSITGVLNCLGVNHYQGCPLRFFWACSRTLPWSLSIISSKTQFLATACSTKTPLSKEADLWVSHTNCSRFQLVEDTIENLTFAPQWRSSLLLLR